MKTLFRTLLYLALIVWLGAEIFFPVVAAITFETLRPDTHTAGMIVGSLLRILHGMGLSCGGIAFFLLARSSVWGIYKPRAVLAPMALLVLAVGLIVYSQKGIIPAMERDRVNAGGTIDAANATNPSRMDFEKLHRRSENVEGAILLLGLATVVFVAKAETEKA
jgi:hypothetical protein